MAVGARRRRGAPGSGALVALQDRCFSARAHCEPACTNLGGLERVWPVGARGREGKHGLPGLPPQSSVEVMGRGRLPRLETH